MMIHCSPSALIQRECPETQVNGLDQVCELFLVYESNKLFVCICNISNCFITGTMVLYKLEKLLLNKRTLEDVAKLSHQHQTSAFEAFHSVILRFAPKNVVYPFIGMLCR